MRKAKGMYPTLRDQYFVKMIDQDRINIKKRITQLTGVELDIFRNKNFDQEIPDMMKKLGDVTDAGHINGDISYNITYIPAFRDVAYYEFIVPFLNKDKID